MNLDNKVVFVVDGIKCMGADENGKNVLDFTDQAEEHIWLAVYGNGETDLHCRYGLYSDKCNMAKQLKGENMPYGTCHHKIKE